MTTLTTRDRELLDRLDRYGVLSTRQVEKTAFPGIRKTTLLRRLRKLEQGQWIRRIQGAVPGAWAFKAKKRQVKGKGYLASIA